MGWVFMVWEETGQDSGYLTGVKKNKIAFSHGLINALQEAEGDIFDLEGSKALNNT